MNNEGYQMEHGPCRYCGKTFRRRVGALIDHCERLYCCLESDETERVYGLHGVPAMTPQELAAYKKAASAYFDRPEDPKDRPLPPKAPKGLNRLTAQESQQRTLDRARSAWDAEDESRF